MRSHTFPTDDRTFLSYDSGHRANVIALKLRVPLQ